MHLTRLQHVLSGPGDRQHVARDALVYISERADGIVALAQRRRVEVICDLRILDAIQGNTAADVGAVDVRRDTFSDVAVLGDRLVALL